MPRRHDTDAGGDAELLAAKARLRDEAWGALRTAKVARFPGAEGRIPNFVGAEAAAERLRGVPAWQGAGTVKANPDAPQWPVRQRALEDGKTLYMAVPRLADAKPFFLLDPARLAGSPRQASSIKGASRSAVTVAVTDLEPVDLVGAERGCAAATQRHRRVHSRSSGGEVRRPGLDARRVRRRGGALGPALSRPRASWAGVARGCVARQHARLPLRARRRRVDGRSHR